MQALVVTRCPRCQRRFPLSGECPAHGRPTSVGEVHELESMPAVRVPAGWTLGRTIAIGGTAIVAEVVGAGAEKTPAVVKWGRWRDRDIRARFAIEAAILQQLGPPTTPALIDHGTIEDWPYLLMEYVAAETLATWMARAGERGGIGEIIAMLTRTASAVGTLHDAGYVHRDLKPENICIGPRGVRLLDFGLAKPLRGRRSELTQIGTIVGTPHYISPEQIRMGDAVDHRADIYALGAIAFEMLAGRPPFVGERRAIEYQHQLARPPSVRESRDIPIELDELVMSCLSKQPDARPASASALRDALNKALTAVGTIRGVGGVTPPVQAKPLGVQTEVALAWIVGGDPVTVTRAIAEVQGIVVRQRGAGILAAFTANHHDVPVAAAITACRDLARERCRVVVHGCVALVRRTAQGKPMVYGRELEQIDPWVPEAPFIGLVLSAGAASYAKRALIPAPDLPGFFRERDAPSGHTTDVEVEPMMVGRNPLVERTVATLAAKPVLVGISGGRGGGKTRVLAAIVTALRAAGREVLEVRAWRRFPGDVPDDEVVMRALGNVDPKLALLSAVQRRVVIAIDDVDQLSRPVLSLLLQDIPLARIVTSTEPMFEVLAGSDDRIAVELPPLSHADASVLLREQLRPARLIPDVLIERLAVRAMGNPRLLLALVRDMKRRGAIRRHVANDQWYVAADELDTLLAPPSPAWLALRAIEDVPIEIAPVLQLCSALGPRFCADEVAAVGGLSDAAHRLGFLLREGVLCERGGWYEIHDAALGEAIYEHMLEQREHVHAAALAYWLAHQATNRVGWLARVAFHAAGAGARDLATACTIALARTARRRGEPEHADAMLARLATASAATAPAAVREALAALDAD